MTRADGAITRYGYDGADRLTDLNTVVGGSPVAQYHYTLNRQGLRMVAQESIGGTSAPRANGAAPAISALAPTTSAVSGAHGAGVDGGAPGLTEEAHTIAFTQYQLPSHSTRRESVLSTTANDGLFAAWNYNLETLVGWSNNGFDLTVVGRYTMDGGPCHGKNQGSCRFDTRTLLTDQYGQIESITAYGHFWNYDGVSRELLNSGTLTDIPRYANGPCANQSGLCKFESRTIFTNSSGARIEFDYSNGQRVELRRYYGSTPGNRWI